jgi:hypothetical protein
LSLKASLGKMLARPISINKEGVTVYMSGCDLSCEGVREAIGRRIMV